MDVLNRSQLCSSEFSFNIGIQLPAEGRQEQTPAHRAPQSQRYLTDVVSAPATGAAPTNPPFQLRARDRARWRTPRGDKPILGTALPPGARRLRRRKRALLGVYVISFFPLAICYRDRSLSPSGTFESTRVVANRSLARLLSPARRHLKGREPNRDFPPRPSASQANGFAQNCGFSPTKQPPRQRIIRGRWSEEGRASLGYLLINSLPCTRSDE